ncbi:hypothetical protein VTN49DRAFT_220 [Thermomyces lanuginosus]|uniref:uncharacterized protein n=1 Tax=Thermomyces lanuginosus TaxID=5541 RepID=UPI0037430E79
MCIAIISTAHPAYSLIVADNRDEFLHRPTAAADWWQTPNQHVLGSRDLARPDQGTWMGVTKQGRIAVLTNYTEQAPIGSASRGAIVNAFLTQPPTAAAGKDATRRFVQDLIDSNVTQNVGGFSLVCGRVNEPLALVSNRMESDPDRIPWIGTRRGETVALSNTVYGDRSWRKIVDGERLMNEAIEAHVRAGGKDEDDLIRRLLDVLSTDTLPRVPGPFDKEKHVGLLRESVFIPMVGDLPDGGVKISNPSQKNNESDPTGMGQYMSGPYGTQKQTILLVGFDGRVKYFERTLYDQDVKPIPIGQGDRTFEFMVEE